MNVKVQLQGMEDGKKGKIEYFNQIDEWQTDGNVLHLYRYDEKSDRKVVASIRYWEWIKADE